MCKSKGKCEFKCEMHVTISVNYVLWRVWVDGIEGDDVRAMMLLMYPALVASWSASAGPRDP